MQTKPKVLLIGGAGYVGTVIASHLLKENKQVRILDNFIYDHQFSIYHLVGDPDFEIMKGDLTNTSDLKKAIKDVSDVVILGGLVGDPITKKYPEQSESINQQGIIQCMNFLNGKGLNRVLFISTCSNYGLIKEDELADEEFKLNPLSLYAIAKVESEKHFLSMKDSADFTGVILRFATAFGISPRMRFDLTVNEFVRDLFYGEELLVYDEDTWRPYCHVRDFARLIGIVLEVPDDKIHFEVFNAGGEVNNFTKRMIVDQILKRLPEGNVTYNSKGSDPRNYRVSFAKVKNALGFEPKYTVEQGIEELIEMLQIGMYSDSLSDPDKYGNYNLHPVK